MRWRNYVLERGDGQSALWFEQFKGKESTPLFVMAKSFDPRTCTALEQLLATDAINNLQVKMLHYDSGDEVVVDEDLAQRAADNKNKAEELVEGHGTIIPEVLKTDSNGQQRNTANSAKEVFSSYTDIQDFSDIIVDVSGMPRSVFFPLISKLLWLIDDAEKKGTSPLNLFVVVSEDPNVDKAIKHEGVDPFAELLPFYRGRIERAAEMDLPIVWIPILGENRLAQLECIENVFNSQLEIWPILPSPSRNPRRGDNLFIEYQTYLLDNHGIDTRNFIYASEDNPFEVYRQLCQATEDCLNTLTPLGGCHVVYSALSSKLMSLGTLLAAFDLKTRETNKIDVGIAHVGCNNYRLENCQPNTEVFGLWLTGRCYDVV